jgi:hypothetical protein
MGRRRELGIGNRLLPSRRVFGAKDMVCFLSSDRVREGLTATFSAQDCWGSPLGHPLAPPLKAHCGRGF